MEIEIRFLHGCGCEQGELIKNLEEDVYKLKRKVTHRVH